MPHILLTNDDGYQAEGLRALAAALEGFATVSIVAASREQSGTAQSLTLRQPIVCNKISGAGVGHRWDASGLRDRGAAQTFCRKSRDMVISGINHGANLGENVYYSGTGGSGARRRATSHSIGGDVAMLEKRKSEI